MTAAASRAERWEDEALSWLDPKLREAYAGLGPAVEEGRERAIETDRASRPEPGEVGPAHWRDALREYRQRAAAAPAGARAAAAPGAPAIAGARSWLPLGPNVVLQGQTVGEQPVAGRIPGIAVAPGGRVVYVASANGGVFRSDDGATTWRSTMDGFDVDPTSFASASLVCGAIAIDPADPDRVYVGTGEGDTAGMFRLRMVSALPAYRGIGPVRSDDGGKSWKVEDSTPDLAGEAFYALAVDPRDREHVVGATTAGLYERVPAGQGAHRWERRRSGVHTSVAVASSGSAKRFFAAEHGVGVLASQDGRSWTALGGGFPSANVGRIALGVQAGRMDLVYAAVAKTSGSLLGVYRLEGNSWKALGKLPNVLPGSQGDYDLAIAVDPKDANLVYVSGDYVNIDPYPGSVWRLRVDATGKVKATSIGTHAHSDVHSLVHTPGDPDELWCGCDGGLFLNRDPRGSGEFASQNDGLSCLCSNFLGQHPTDPGVIFVGLQDNGTARTAHGPTWTHVNYGDGGYCLVNWANPDLVLVFANGTVFRSQTGGRSHEAWQRRWNFNWATMTQPIVSPPYNPKRKADASWVAVAAGEQISISKDFAASWDSKLSFLLPGGSGAAFALAFASPTRLFIGTTTGRVFRANRAGSAWTVSRIDDVAAGPLGLHGLVTDVAVDWSDPARESIYLCFGGVGDRRRVWWFDGKAWHLKSGAAGHQLLDVEHNALTVDPAFPDHVYVGADIGVWHSRDRGATWQPVQNGLPDAPVYDLQIHPTQRLLRAATYGRGVWELAID